MARNSNQSAQAAKELKKQLTTRFPGIKFSVTSDTYTGGSSISVAWAFGPTVSQVEELSSLRVKGHFNGMEDIYEVTGTCMEVGENGEVKHVAGAKHIFENRNTRYEKDSYNAREDVKKLYKQIGELNKWEHYENGDYTPGGAWNGHDQSASTIYSRTATEISFVSDNIELLEIKWTGYEYCGKRWNEPYTIVYKDLETGKTYDGKTGTEQGAPTTEQLTVVITEEITEESIIEENSQTSKIGNLVFLLDYSEKSFVVFGKDTYDIEEDLLGNYGMPNHQLKHPKTGERFTGFVFSLKRKEAVVELLKKYGIL